MSKERTWNLICKKLAGEASEQELAELEALLRTDPDMHYSVQTVQEIWELPVRHPNPDNNLFNQHIDRLKAAGGDWADTEPEKKNVVLLPIGRRSSSFMRRYLPTLGLAGLLLASSWWVVHSYGRQTAVQPTADQPTAIQQNEQPEKYEISTPNGSRTRIQLPDGSQVWLNSGSQLKYPGNFGSKIREVELTGEALFDVVKNPQKPFVIHTAVLDIKVLGTRFNVKSYPTDKTTETSLFRGRVEVILKNRPKEKHFLMPNEKLVVLNDEAEALPKTSNLSPKPLVKAIPETLVATRNLTYQRGDTTSVEEAWINNILSFKDEPFDEVARKMERWYDVEFAFKNKSLLNIHMTGSFTNETLQQAMEALQYSVRFHFQIKDRKVTIY